MPSRRYDQIKRLASDVSRASHERLEKLGDINDPSSPWPTLTSEDEKALREIAVKYDRALERIGRDLSTNLDKLKEKITADKRVILALARKTQDVRVTKPKMETLAKVLAKAEKDIDNFYSNSFTQGALQVGGGNIGMADYLARWLLNPFRT